MQEDRAKAIVIGAGMGGLSAALYLRALGLSVTVFDTLPHPGGKIRARQSPAGPVDTGPTVLTMLPVIADLFAAHGASVHDAVSLSREPVLARHFWPDGATLDLSSDPDTSAAAIAAFAGQAEARAFAAFRARAQRLFDGFSQPVMQATQPGMATSVRAVMHAPGLLRDMAPHRSLAGLLRATFQDPRLRQLFGRYATYVGGSPFAVPALLSLIWRAEEAGVWQVAGGMHVLAEALADLARKNGIGLRLGTGVTAIFADEGRAGSVQLDSGETHSADLIVFNGDPRALTQGLLGRTVVDATPAAPLEERSLSANVLAFAAAWQGPPIVHHNLFFTRDPRDEFDPIAKGQPPRAATLYLCAQDRDADHATPNSLERFEIIENAPPLTDGQPYKEDRSCLTRIRTALNGFGAALTPFPDAATLTRPADFAAMFPASLGALYGQSPRGLTAAFQRPTARTRIPGLYLAGGGTHPGAGVPMAALSGRHAAEAIATDLGLTWPFRPTAMPGGMSTASRIADATPSRSSLS